MSSESESESEYTFLYMPNFCDWDGEGEDLERYCIGGLHPVHLNDFFDTSSPGSEGYRILHKLGYGGFSHVWYGQNLDAAHAGHRGAALKFIASDQTGKSLEAEINNFLASRSRDAPGFQNVALCLETFQVSGPNGIHDVIVSEPAIPIASLFSDTIEHLDDCTIFQQTLSGVAFLHKHGVVHRDLHLGNIAVEFPFLRTAGVVAIMKGSGHPVCHALLPGAPTTQPLPHPIYVVQNARFCRRLHPSMIADAESFVVKIIDFGCSFRPTMDVPPDPNYGPVVFDPPECNISAMIPGKKLLSTVQSVHGSLENESYRLPLSEREKRLAVLESRDLSDLVWSAQGDVWVVGCTLFSILVRDETHIFLHGSGGPVEILTSIAKYLGPVPERYRRLLQETANVDSYWRSQQCARALEIDSSLSDPHAIEGSWTQLEQNALHSRAGGRKRMAETSPLHALEDEKRVRGCLQVLRQMLRWSPGDRISASEAANSPSLRTTCST